MTQTCYPLLPNSRSDLLGVACKSLRALVFEPFQIEHITNGVHAATWVCPEFQELFDSRISGWRADNFSLRYALGVPPLEIWSAHMKAKRSLIELVNDRANTAMEM